MIRVWGRPNSLCTQRVLWCLAELELEAELILASAVYGPGGHVWRGNMPYGIVDTDAYRAMNPNGTVPTMADERGPIWDSNAIVSYLALRHGPQLYDSDPLAFGRRVAWMGWCNGQLGGVLAKAVAHLERLPPDQRDPAILRQAEEEIAPPLRILDETLAASTFVAGPNLGIGDIALGPFLARWDWFELAWPEVPFVRQWLQRLADRPAYRDHVLPRHFHRDE